ncbi:hypothetical protein SISSUDRAFT_525475 [Sistotremastrum suecicum HHB10207 ss-3]|uniref:F-box domain-containing protein n=1 Tax=Sistotremastrum suecicum HHB10207 ss-3 TaxID=1314776 RepID=A0A166F6S3_9AGAM|nr:hypothetical protein SISSUDRAFT_525475 [Sistotremastrum suecicum HHB10207 ss-3]
MKVERSIKTMKFDLEFPVEIWRIILYQACNPVTEEEVSNILASSQRQSLQSLHEPDYQSMLSLILTCRTFTKLVLPFLLRFIQIPFLNPLPYHGLPKSSSTLTLPLPKAFGTPDRCYGDFVRYISIGKLHHLSETLNSCPNVSHLIIHGNQFMRHIPDIGIMLSGLKSLVALHMPECIARLPHVRDGSIHPRHSLENLKLLHVKIHTDNPDYLEVCSWEIPNLHRVVMGSDLAMTSVTGAAILQLYGQSLQSLSFVGPRFVRILKAPLLESFCPLLTHLQIESPDRLLEGTEHGESSIIHHGVTTVTFAAMTWES